MPIDITKKINAVSFNGSDWPLAEGEFEASAPTITEGSANITASGFTAASSSTGYAVTLSTTAGSAKSNATATKTGKITSGATEQSSATSVPVTKTTETIYIPKATITPGISSTTKPSVTINATPTGFTASSSSTSYYVTSSGTGTSGSVIPNAAKSQVGMVDATTVTGSSSTVGVTVGSSKTTYLPVATVTPSVTVNSNPTAGATGTANGFTESSSTTNYYVTATPTQTSTGSVTPKASKDKVGMVNASTVTGTAVSTNLNIGSSDTVYIPEATVTPGIASKTGPTVGATGTPHGFTASSSATDYYVTAAPVQTASGSVTPNAAKDKVGMVDAATVPGSATSVDYVAGASANVYIPVGDVGTVSAVKSAVSGNAITVTPQVAAGTAGYNAHSAYSGTAVSVSASEVTSGTLTIIPTTSSQTVSVVNYANVTVEPLYTEISTSAGMDAVLVAANLGKLYKYTGTTDTKYTNGRIYEVEEC